MVYFPSLKYLVPFSFTDVAIEIFSSLLSSQFSLTCEALEKSHNYCISELQI